MEGKPRSRSCHAASLRVRPQLLRLRWQYLDSLNPLGRLCRPLNAAKRNTGPRTDGLRNLIRWLICFWFLFSSFWALLGFILPILTSISPTWNQFAAILDDLGLILNNLGPIWGPLGPSWGLSWAILGGLGAMLWPSWAIPALSGRLLRPFLASPSHVPH